MSEYFSYITPEKAGISSQNIIKFMDELEHYGVFLHGFVIAKGHNIFAEGYRKPFEKNELHRMYSVSKTFASMAIGVLVGEGKVNLEDPVIKYFPEYDSKVMDQYVRNMKIEHLLKMSTCFSYPTTYGAKKAPYLEPNWIDTFFTVNSSHPSGTVWNYDTSASYMLDVIVERITGMPFLEYLKEKALLKIGFSKDARCLKAPEGHSWGGSAVLASTLDLARFARLVMDGGEWNGEQLIPKDYIEKATSNVADNAQEGFITCYSGHGYGYQIWRTLDDTFSFVGMGGQLAICMPKENMLFACNADIQGIPGSYTPIYMNLWKNVKELISENSIAENNKLYEELQNKCKNLEYPVYPGATTSPISKKVFGKTYILQNNPMGITDISFDCDNNGNGIMKYHNAQGVKELKFGIGKTVVDKFPQDGYFGDTIGKSADRRYRCIASGAWTNEKTLHIKCDIIDDYFGNLSIVACFEEEKIALYMQPHAEWFLLEYNGFASGDAAK